MSDTADITIYPVLKDKVALITGGAQGMGKTTCEVFLRAGAKVVMCDVKQEAGAAVARELSALGDIHFVQTDISSSEQVQSLVAETVSRFGRLDAAVNNAARTPDTNTLIDLDEDYWRGLVDVNLTGTALCCKYQMRQMIAQGGGGSIVNIASVSAFRAWPNMPAYTAAKHALIGVTKHASMEGGPHGIRVNTIAPGPIYSEMSASALRGMSLTETEFASKFCYLERFGQPHEVAQGSLWLSSDAASFVTGIVLPIDGGALIK